MQHPQKIGKYVIIERIGRGGMGYVYRAQDPILKRDVAIKTMLRDVSEDPELRTRFMREAQSAGGLRHPNIVTIYDLGEAENGCPYIAMEFLTGTDLEQIIKNRVELLLTKKLEILIQTSNGLAYAHNNGIVHRDIKPANIRLLDNGEAKIMDFGIAKITASRVTRTGMIMGTPHYMAPEQIRGEVVDRRADIFSLGVVLYELLTFRKPFSGENPTTVLFKIIHADPDPLGDSVFIPPAGLEDVVTRCLAKKLEDRYQSCEELGQDLIKIYAEIDPDADPSSRLTPLPYSITRTPMPTGRPKAATRASQSIAAVPQNFSTTPQPASGPTSNSESGLSPASVILPSEPKPDAKIPEYSSADQIDRSALTPPTSHPVDSSLLVSLSPKKWFLLGAAGLVSLGILIFLILGVVNALKNQQQATRDKNPSPVIENKLQKKENILPAPPPGPMEKDSVAPVPVPAKPVMMGSVSLNILPWAEIVEIKNKDGTMISPPVGITPCKFQLEAGLYQIRLVNPAFNPMVLSVEVKENATTFVRKTMVGFDHAKAVDSVDF